jgi:hypothetical protein
MWDIKSCWRHLIIRSNLIGCWLAFDWHVGTMNSSCMWITQVSFMIFSLSSKHAHRIQYMHYLILCNILRFLIFEWYEVRQKKKKRYVCLLSLAEKIGSVGRIYFFISFLFWNLVSLVFFLELLIVIFLYLLTVLNTLSAVIDDIIPLGSRKRQSFPDIKNFQKFSNKTF